MEVASSGKGERVAIGASSILNSSCRVAWSPLHFFFSNFLSEDIYTDDSKTIKELKNIIVSELGHLYSQIIGKALTDLETIRSPAVTLHKRAQMGSLTLNAADGEPRVGMASEIANQLCHFIDNRMLSYFWKHDDKYKNYLTKHEHTFDLDTR